MNKKGLSDGASQLIIFVIFLSVFYPIFLYGISSPIDPDVTLPSGINPMVFACLNLTGIYSDYQNVSKLTLTYFDIYEESDYRVLWTETDVFLFQYEHWFYDPLNVTFGGVEYEYINASSVIARFESGECGNYTLAYIDKGGGKEQTVLFMIPKNSTGHDVYSTINDAIANEEVMILVGGQLPKLETDFFAVAGIIGTNYLTGLTAPFTEDDYPVILALFSWTITLLGVIALMLYVRG